MSKDVKGIFTVKNKLMVLLLLSTLIPIVVISLLLNNYLKENLQENFVQSATKETRQVDNAISTFFQTVEENAKMLATDPNVLRADNTITTYMQNAGQDGKVKNTAMLNGGVEAQIFQVYDHFAASHPETAYAYMGTSNGGYIQWPNSDLPANYDPRLRPWYKQALANPEQVTRTAPYFWAVDNSSIISTVTTIKDASGQVIGVQGLDVSLKGLTDMIKKIKIGDSGYVLLVSDDGTIIADPKNPELNFKNIKELQVTQLEDLANLKDTSLEITLNKQAYVANIYTSPKTGWKFIALVAKAELMQDVTQMQHLIITLALVFVLLAGLISFIFASRFSKPIVAAAGFAHQIAGGNLTAEQLSVSSKDEIGTLSAATNEMQANLKSMIKQIRKVSEELVATSEELTATSQEASSTMGEIMASMDGTAVELDKDIAQQQEGVKRALVVMDELSAFIQQIAQGADEQANKVVAMAETTSQMAAALEEVAANAQAVSQASKATSGEAASGEQAVLNSIQGMHEIKDTVFEAAQKISQLGSHSQQIGEIVSVIDDIAEQTNLLALNAAIEAARAGEHGKGFAVVADEVRKLAERSSKSTREIGELIIAVQSLTEDAVKAMDKGTQEVEAGVLLSENAGRALKQIIGNVTETDGQINSISAVIEELSASSTEIVQAVDQVSRIAETNATASRSMNEKASGVTQAITEISQRASNSAQFVREATDSAGRVAHMSENITSATEGLVNIAQELQEEVKKFQV